MAIYKFIGITKDIVDEEFVFPYSSILIDYDGVGYYSEDELYDDFKDRCDPREDKLIAILKINMVNLLIEILEIKNETI